jgi:hypothetical protein
MLDLQVMVLRDLQMRGRQQQVDMEEVAEEAFSGAGAAAAAAEDGVFHGVALEEALVLTTPIAITRAWLREEVADFGKVWVQEPVLAIFLDATITMRVGADIEIHLQAAVGEPDGEVMDMDSLHKCMPQHRP